MKTDNTPHKPILFAPENDIDPVEDDSLVWRHVDRPPREIDPSPFWIVAVAGLVLTTLAGIVIFETFQIVGSGTSEWADCVQGKGGAFLACGRDMTLAYDYRFGIDAMLAMGLALLAAFAGPIPLIMMLSRFKNRVVSGLLFLLVMVPYGMLSFFILIVAAVIIIFYGAQVVG